jgi:hypothetical protein
MRPWVASKHDVVADGHAFGHVVAHHQAGGAGGVVERAYELGGHAHADEVQAGKGLVVHDEFGVQRNGARQRHAPRHAARHFTDAQPGRAAQAHGVELHQHQVADHGFGQRGVLSHRKGHVLEHREVGEQRAELEQHAQTSAQAVELGPVAGVDQFTVKHHTALVGGVHTADQAHQGGLAAARTAQDGGDLATRKLERHVRQDGPACVVAKRDVVDLDEGVVGQADAGRGAGCTLIALLKWRGFSHAPGKPQGCRIAKWMCRNVQDSTRVRSGPKADPSASGRPGRLQAHRGSTLQPIRNSSTARAACRPSRMAHTTRLWPRRMSPAAKTLSTLVL